MNHPLIIGLYPFGLAAGPDGIASGPPDDLNQIVSALTALRGSGPPLLTRAYAVWTGPDDAASTLDVIENLLHTGLTWDLVLAYRDRDGDIQSWCTFVTDVVHDLGNDLAAIQITGEANLAGIAAAGDGSYPGAVDALVHGILAAAYTKRDVHAKADIGFAVVPERDPARGIFWPALAAAGGPRFAAGIDYVGLDMYPDVFGGHVKLEDLATTVERTLRTLRHVALPIAGITASTPIRVCETGWPTGPDRSDARQADVLDVVLRAVHRLRQELNVTHWELFALRDADSSKPDPFHQFGILRDDYTPKPSFGRLLHTLADLAADKADTPPDTAALDGTLPERVADFDVDRRSGTDTLTTGRLTLRETSDHDLDAIATLLGDAQVMRYYPRPKTRNEAQQWIAWNQQMYQDRGFGLWMITLRSNGQFIGECGLTVQVVDNVAEIEIGYHVIPAHQRRGYATEAASACLNVARVKFGIDRIIAVIHPDNTPSRLVAERIGMRLEKHATMYGQGRLIYATPRCCSDASGTATTTEEPPIVQSG